MDGNAVMMDSADAVVAIDRLSQPVSLYPAPEFLRTPLTKRQLKKQAAWKKKLEKASIKLEDTCLWVARKKIWFFVPDIRTKYYLTKEKLVVKHGFFNTKYDEILLFRIRDVTTKKSFIQKIFNVGTINVRSTDESMPHVTLTNVKITKRVSDKISDLASYWRMKRGMAGLSEHMESANRAE